MNQNCKIGKVYFENSELNGKELKRILNNTINAIKTEKQFVSIQNLYVLYLKADKI